MNQTKKKSNVISINMALCPDGFDPRTLIREFTDKNSGMFNMALARIAWFRLVYPKGKIALEDTGDNAGNICKVTAKVYTDFELPEDHFIAKASCRCEPDAEGFYPSLAATQEGAVSAALRIAGFIIPGVLDGGIQTPADDTKNDEQSSMQGEPAATAQLPAANETSDEELVNMTYEEAYQVLCPLSSNKDVPLGALVVRDPGTLKYLRDNANDHRVRRAADVICGMAVHAAAV